MTAGGNSLVRPWLRRLRFGLAGLAFASYGAIVLADRLDALLSPPNSGRCSAELFGTYVPPNPPTCYIPVGDALLLFLGTLVVALALTLAPDRMAKPVVLVSMLLAILLIPEVMYGRNPWSPALWCCCLLAAVPFIIDVPQGPFASAVAHQRWIRVVRLAVGLAVFDTAYSSILQTVSPGLQFSFAIVALAVVAAGIGASALDRLSRTTAAASVSSS